jgi:hypothetical protein
MVMNFWDLQGPSGFLADIEEGLRANRAGVVVFPAHGPAGFRSTLSARLAQRGWYRVGLSWTEGDHPLNFLFRELGIRLEIKERQSVTLLLQQLESMVIVIDDIPAVDWPEWKRFLQDYERALRLQSNGQGPLLLCVLSGVERDVARLHSAAIAMYYWSGVVSELDALVYIRALTLNLDRPAVEKDITRRMVSRLCLWDITLAGQLIELPINELAQPVGVLSDLARDRQWATGDACSWSKGTEDIFEGQRMHHSLWLSMNCGHSELEFRIWGAQAAVGLPLVEQRRRELAPRASRYLRFPLNIDGEIITSVMGLEIGQLSHQLFLANCKDHELMRKVRFLKNVRNALAHVEVVDPTLLLNSDLVSTGRQ